MNGAIVFDDRYIGKPLVYCGTVGIMPRTLPDGRPSHVKTPVAGDIVYMVGGRVGYDGIHGATFSSLELTEESPSSAVQIGDPITQKKMLDMVLESARRQPHHVHHRQRRWRFVIVHWRNGRIHQRL